MADLPKPHELFKPTLEALVELGGLASIEEIEHRITDRLGLGAVAPRAARAGDILATSRGAAAVRDRMAWARSGLKHGRFLENPRRGAWVLTEAGRGAASRPADEIRRLVARGYGEVAERRQAPPRPEAPSGAALARAAGAVWSDRLLACLQAIEPAAFERLCQRLLRESGFTRVEVTGKSGDGGIDGFGVLRMNLVSFHVLFQCKRWRGAVGSEAVRNFRGAMQGRADKGLIITTGAFTAEAQREATRDGAPAIDLIDGPTLCGLLKERGLGVSVREVRVEEVSVDEAFFAAI